MVSNFFIEAFGKTARGGQSIRPAESDSSTGMPPPSSAPQRAWKWSAFFLLALLFAQTSNAVALSHQEALGIGGRIWQNECGGTLAGLTSWNAGEDFASLGIGHFIWYPAGRRGPFEESFPDLLRYFQARGQTLPDSLGANSPCPWNSRADFLAAETSSQMVRLRKFLAEHD